MPSDMIVLARVFDLLNWLLPKGERFPRAYRHTVTKRLMDAALDLQDGLFLAQTRAGAARLGVLNDCDAALSRLRLYLRLAHHWHWLNNAQYEHVSRMDVEIGRLLGVFAVGWVERSETHPASHLSC
jgi:hypothetical protein